jgi:hypothetical protein
MMRLRKFFLRRALGAANAPTNANSPQNFRFGNAWLAAVAAMHV